MPLVDTSSGIWAAVQASHRARVRVDVVSSSGVLLETIYPTGGSVTADSTRANRRNLDLELVDYSGTLIPLTPDALLAPFSGNELLVYRGVELPDQSWVDVQLGRFSIVDVKASRGDAAVTLSISAEDRSWRISRNVLRSTLPIAADTTVEDAIALVLADRYPSIPLALSSTSWTTPSLRPGIDGGLDPWQFCRDLALAAGLELYVDHTGTVISRGVPQIDASVVVASFTEDSSSVMLSLSRGLSIDGLYNGVRVTAEGTETGVSWSSTKWDDDEQSPTYRDPAADPGPADRLYEISTPLVRGSSSETSQTETMASAALQTVIGQPIDLEAVPNPALDVGDIVGISSTVLGINTTAIVDRVTIPLEVDGTMSVTCRARRLSK